MNTGKGEQLLLEFPDENVDYNYQQDGFVTSAAIFLSLRQSSLDIAFKDMTFLMWHAMSQDEQHAYINHIFPSTQPKEIAKAHRDITLTLLGKLSHEDKRYYAHAVPGIMTNKRPVAELYRNIPRFEQTLDDLPFYGVKVADIGSGECIALEQVREVLSEYDPALQTYAVDMHQPHAIESLQSTFLQQDLRTGLPAGLPNDLNLVYSNRVIQYLPNLTQLIKDIYNHLAPGGRALLHIGWHFSFTKDCMRELKKSLSQQGHILRARLEYISPDIEDPGVYGIYIDITKTDKPLELPLLDSALPETYSAINKKIIPWSELFYNRKLASEKEYALDKDSVLTQNILPST